MKKIYLLWSTIALCVIALSSNPSRVYAQNKLNGNLSSPVIGTPAPYTKIRNHSANDARSISGQWLDYWFVRDSIAEEATITPSRFYSPLFPDTLGILCSNPTSCGWSQVHLIGNVLDPSSVDMQNYLGYSWSDTNSYWVDSVRIFYSYLRDPNYTNADTLLVYLINDSAVVATDTMGHFASVDLPKYHYTGFSANYGSDTVAFALILYDSTGTNMPRVVTPGVLKTFKIPLTAADTASPGVQINELNIPTNHYSVPKGGKLAAVAFGFKPGYTYNPNGKDTVPGAFYFYSDMPNDGYASGYAPYVPGDYNVSEVVINLGRYQEDPGQFNGLFMPTYSFVGGYQLQEHLIGYYVTGTFDVGVNEHKAASTIKLYQNQPNPANHSTLVRYETLTAGPVTMELRDLTGRLIMELNQGIQSPGKHSASIDLSRLSKGMYLYTLRTDKESITKRMVVSE